MKRTILSLLLLCLAITGYAQADGFNLIVVGDPQTQTEEQFNRLEKDIFPHIATIVEEYRATGYPTAIYLTGDNVWDTLDLMPRLKGLFDTLGIPVLTVIGNHDHDRTTVGDKAAAVARYEEVFGPRNYATELGKTLFLALDNIDYTSYSDYRIAVDRKQLRWLKQALKQSTDIERIAILMHAPAYNYRTDELNDYARKILRRTKGYKVDFITGHRHLNSTADIAPEIIEHSVAQVGGNLWFAPMCPDGTPHSVLTIEERSGEWSWRYRLLGESAEKQIMIVEDNADEVVIRIVGWDKKWSVEWAENGKDMGAMERTDMVDPDYRYYVENEADYNDMVMGHLRRKLISFPHYYRLKRTTENSEITITATDRFGRKYTIKSEKR